MMADTERSKHTLYRKQAYNRLEGQHRDVNGAKN
jgi:hypothetical protein